MHVFVIVIVDNCYAKIKKDNSCLNKFQNVNRVTPVTLISEALYSQTSVKLRKNRFTKE
jgi:hypothetical protein